jgi:spermidine synthase
MTESPLHASDQNSPDVGGSLPLDDRLPFSSSLFVLAVCSLGFSAFLTQLTLMRELVSAFSGNELVFGIVLGVWMLMTGIGASLGQTATRWRWLITAFILAEILIALLPIADVFLLRWLRNVVFLRGAEVGVTETVAACLVLLTPYCLTTGFALTAACQIASLAKPDALTLALSRPTFGRCPERGHEGIGRVYLFDNLGNVFGGVLFLAVLAQWFNHFGMLYFAGLPNLLFAGLLATAANKRYLAASIIVILATVFGLMTFGRLDDRSRRLEYAGQQILFHGDSPYGSLVVTRSAGQLNFIESGVPLFSTQDVAKVEEDVHYAMAQRPIAKKRSVLLISGGVSGTARELLKYPVKTIDYVELDPLILDVAEHYLPESLDDPRIHIIQGDGRQFVRQTDNRYDVVIVNVPDPSTSQLNRFYTREFFAETHRILNPGGVVSCSLGTYENYVSKELAQMLGVAKRTLQDEFANVLLLPGNRVFLLASDAPLTSDIAAQLEKAGVKPRLIGRDYLKGTLTRDRMAALNQAIAPNADANEDFNPILYYLHLRYWMSQFDVRFGLFEGVLAALLAIYVVCLRPVPLVIFCGGFAASALEVVLLLAFQILFGSLYYQVGLIVTVFMVGLVIGAALVKGHGASPPTRSVFERRSGDPAHRNFRPILRRRLMLLALAVALLAAILPTILLALGQLEGPIASMAGRIVIPLLVAFLAVLVGMEFPLAAQADFHTPAKTSARLYTADYVGAALGALLVSTWLIPVLGVVVVCLLTAGLNLLAAVVLWIRKA